MAIPGYRILRKIRQGGMSTVYLAIQQSVDREVAIKVMSPSLNSDPSFGSRFYREAKIVGQLSHPNIVSIYDVGSHRQYNYIAMDYLPGAPLQNRLKEGISQADAITIVREMAAALDYAHQRGYIHRDIKPDNILFREDGAAVLCDFGIAKALKGQAQMTNVGSVLGTPHYMSPEQAQGKEIDGRADLYSLGVVLYQMLCGQVPYDGDDAVAIAVQHMTAPLPTLPNDLRALQPLIDKMMSKKAAERFQTGREIIAALDAFEQPGSDTSVTLRTTTGSTTVQLLGMIKTLAGSLSTTIGLAFKRLMLTRINLRPSHIQLSRKQLDDIDDFVLDDSDDELLAGMEDEPLIQDTIEQPAIRPQLRWLPWLLAALLPLVIVGYLLTDKSAPEAEAALDNASPENELTVTATEPADLAEPEVTGLENPDLDQPTADDEDAETDDIEQPQPTDPPPNYALVVNTEPADARVRILNIKPRFSQGMQLPAGSYHIEVSAKSYLRQRLWVSLEDRDRRLKVRLTPAKITVLHAVGSVIEDSLKIGGQAPAMLVLPAAASGRPYLAVSRHEIRFQDYDQFARHRGRTLPEDKQWGRDDRPVINVSYWEARDYAQWLSEQTGYRYRLPTQAEWQYAASAGTETDYWWGNEEEAKKRANCRRGCFSKYTRLLKTTTAPVGQYEANPFGLQDTSGNVAEWLDACQQQSEDGARCESTLTAGGSFRDASKDISNRSFKTEKTGRRSRAIGFRLVRELGN